MSKKILLFIAMTFVCFSFENSITTKVYASEGAPQEEKNFFQKFFTIDNFFTYLQGQTPTQLSIASCQDLQDISNNLVAHYTLTQDVDCSGFSFTPIGTQTAPFTGNINGGDFVVNNLTINQSSTDHVALLSYANGAGISSIGFRSISITGQQNVAGIIANAIGTSIAQSYVRGSIISTSYRAGGIVGIASSATTISDSYFDGNITARKGGGIAGFLTSSTLNRVYADAVIITDPDQSSDLVGGLVASFSSGNINDSFFNGTLTGSNAGSIIGEVWSGQTARTYTSSSLGCVGASHNIAFPPTDCTTAVSVTQLYDHTLSPLSAWNFTTIWIDQVSDFPQLDSDVVSVTTHLNSHYGWNDQIGWVDMSQVTLNTVSNVFAGTASFGSGSIHFDGASNVSLQKTSTTNTDGEHLLSGQVWSDQIGWIFFDDSGGSTSINVTINDEHSINGVAWNNLIGWIFFYEVICESGEDQTCLQVEITAGGLSVHAPDSVNFPDVTVSSSDQTNELIITEPVVLEDLRGSDAGAVVTVNTTHFTTQSNTILFENLAIKTSDITSASSSSLTDVTAPNQSYISFSGDQTISSPITIINASDDYREPGTWQVSPSLRLTIPAFTPPSTSEDPYRAEITFTVA